MGYEAGWAALNLERPDVIPRTEYSVQSHYELINAATGTQVDLSSREPDLVAARKKLLSAWDFSFRWSVLVSRQFLGEWVTSMGHAEYMKGGVDRNDQIHCPFETPEDALAFDPLTQLPQVEHGDLVRRFEEQYRKNCDFYGDAVNMTGTYITMVSGFIDIFGWDMLLMVAGLDPEQFGWIAQRYEQWIRPFFEALADSDVPVVMVHDDIVWSSGPFLHPDWYRAFVFPAYKRLWQPLVDAGKIIVFTSDGTYDMFFDDILACGARTLVVEPGNDMASFVERHGRTHGYIGDVDTRVLLTGSREAIRAEVERSMTTGRDCPGFFQAVGNHIPSNTPVESGLYYNEVYMELRDRTALPSHSLES